VLAKRQGLAHVTVSELKPPHNEGEEQPAASDIVGVSLSCAAAPTIARALRMGARVSLGVVSRSVSALAAFKEAADLWVCGVGAFKRCKHQWTSCSRDAMDPNLMFQNTVNNVLQDRPPRSCSTHVLAEDLQALGYCIRKHTIEEGTVRPGSKSSGSPFQQGCLCTRPLTRRPVYVALQPVD
jgi:hypothetical protein